MSENHGQEHLSDLSTSSLLRKRQELYPTIYKPEQTAQDIQAVLDDYAVEVLNNRAQNDVDSQAAGTATTENGDGDGSDNNNNTNGSTPSEPSGITTRQMDIYGRIPGKEPKEPVLCSVCSRFVNAMRFAPHLDKCMGLGVGSRVNTR